MTKKQPKASLPKRSRKRKPSLREALAPELSPQFSSESQHESSITARAGQLNNPHWQTAQRQTLATELGGVQGNAQFQKLVGRGALAHPPVTSQIARLVNYNPGETKDRFTDPEQASGLLPFNEEGWDGLEIGKKLSQLSPVAPRHDNLRCVETSFLVALVQRGPGALRSMIENYLARYRLGLRQASTPESIKRWYRRSLQNLTPLLGKIDEQTLTYEDISVILSEMYNVYGSPSGGTSLIAEMSMLRREGNQAQALNLENVTQDQAVTLAQAILPGEILSCGVEASKKGTGPVSHAVHIGRHPATGKLYFYDPWPVKGNQLLECSEGLTEITHYFWNPLENEEDATEEDDIEISVARTFSIDAKYTPPGEEGEVAS